MPDPLPGNPLRKELFQRLDESPDARFYRDPRLVTHIDDAAIQALTDYYRDILPPGGRILDLMSSWVSHLPDDVEYASVTGLGMNREELDHNPRLTRRVAHDLNVDPALPFPDASFDAALIAVSIQYLVRPTEVLAEVARVLVPGASLIVSFSNRCFPMKAVAAWRSLDDSGHAYLVELYFRHSGSFEPARSLELRPGDGANDPLFVVVGKSLSPNRRQPPARV